MNVSSGHTMERPPLRGPRVQYSDGSVVTPPPLDVDAILARLERQDETTRHDFLCTFAHSLTVDIRALLIDRPASDVDLDRVNHINEYLHQLTSCVNSRQRRSATGDAELVRTIIDSSYLYGLEAAIGRALATASKNPAPKAAAYAADNPSQLIGTTDSTEAGSKPKTTDDGRLYRVMLKGAIKHPVEVIADIAGKKRWFQHAATAARPFPKVKKAETVEGGVVITAPASVFTSRGIDVADMTPVRPDET